MENKKLILDKENIKYMLEKTLELMPNNPQDGNITCKDVINDNTISKEKTWSSEKIEDFTLKNIDTTWTEVKGVNPSVEFTKEGHMKEVEIFGNTWQDSDDLSDIRHVGELQEDGRYKVEVESCKLNGLYKITNQSENTIIADRRFKVANSSSWSNIVLVRSTNLEIGREYTLNIKLIDWHNINWDDDKFGIFGAWNVGVQQLNLMKNLKKEKYLLQKFKFIPINNEGIGIMLAVQFSPSDDPKTSWIEFEAWVDEGVDSSKQTLLLPCQLSKIGDVQDRLYWNGEKYVIEKNIIKINSSDAMWERNAYVKDNGVFQGAIFDTKGPSTAIVCGSNKIKYYERADWKGEFADNIWIYSKHIYVNLKTNGDDLELFKLKMKEMNFDIYCVNIEPQLIETEITEQIFPSTFKDKTHFFVKGGLDGEIKGKVPINAGQAISVLSSENRELSALNEKAIETNKTQDYLIDVNMLATDELYTIIEPLMENNLLNAQENNSSKMIILYVAMVKRNLKTISEIPEKYREEVLSILSN